MLHEIVGYPLALGPAQIDIEDPVARVQQGNRDVPVMEGSDDEFSD